MNARQTAEMVRGVNIRKLLKVIRDSRAELEWTPPERRERLRWLLAVDLYVLRREFKETGNSDFAS